MTASTCRRALSLTELLIVIGIIVILLSIMIPAALKLYAAAKQLKGSLDAPPITLAACT